MTFTVLMKTIIQNIKNLNIHKSSQTLSTDIEKGQGQIAMFPLYRWRKYVLDSDFGTIGRSLTESHRNGIINVQYGIVPNE